MLRLYNIIIIQKNPDRRSGFFLIHSNFSGLPVHFRLYLSKTECFAWQRLPTYPNAS